MTTYIRDGRPDKPSSIKCNSCGSAAIGAQKGGARARCDSCNGDEFLVGDLKCSCGESVFNITKLRVVCSNCGADNVWNY